MVALPKHETNIISIAKRCPVCGLPAFSARATYCQPNSKCKSVAYRRRRSDATKALRAATTTTTDALLAAQLRTNQLLEQLLKNGISTTTAQPSPNAQPTTPVIASIDLPELQATKAKAGGNSSRVNLLNALSSISNTKKISIKPEAKPAPKSNIISGSKITLDAPDFEDLEI